MVVYDMSTNSLVFNTISYIETSLGGSTCVTYSDSFHVLFVLGGYNSDVAGKFLNSVQALSLSDVEWLQNAPSMQTKRAKGGCIVDPETGTLWTVGGEIFSSTYTDTVERIAVSDILSDSSSWRVLSSVLANPSVGLSVLCTVDGIIVMGGFASSSSLDATAFNDVQRIDVRDRHGRLLGLWDVCSRSDSSGQHHIFVWRQKRKWRDVSAPMAIDSAVSHLRSQYSLDSKAE